MGETSFTQSDLESYSKPAEPTPVAADVKPVTEVKKEEPVKTGSK